MGTILRLLRLPTPTTKGSRMYWDSREWILHSSGRCRPAFNGSHNGSHAEEMRLAAKTWYRPRYRIHDSMCERGLRSVRALPTAGAKPGERYPRGRPRCSS